MRLIFNLLMTVLLSLSLKAGPARAGEAATQAAPVCLHNVPKSICFICDESLRDKDRPWCMGHSRYEDRCWECHPDARDTKRPFCDEHGLYEDECIFCNPKLRIKPSTNPTVQPSPAPDAKPRLMCKEHHVFEDECGICHPDMAGKLEPGQGLKVRFASPKAAGKAEIKTARPLIGSASSAVEGFAEIQFNRNRLAHIVAPAAGIIQEAELDLGGSVTGNMVVVKMFSADYQKALSELPMRLAAVERERKLNKDFVSSKKDLEEAEAAYKTVLGTIRQFNPSGFDPDAVLRLPAETALLELRAPFAGEIIERDAVRGAFIETGKKLMEICDCSTMWADISIPEARLGSVSTGLKVELAANTLAGQTFTGKLTWISAQIDERTRMAKARAEIPNPDGRLRARMFAAARIITGNSGNALLVPSSALQQMEGKPFVFIKLQDDLFEARAVLTGARHDNMVEISAGIAPEDNVVTENGFLVKSQMLISRLGAGCCPE